MTHHSCNPLHSESIQSVMTQPMVRHGGRTSKISRGSGVMTQGFSVTTHVLNKICTVHRHDALYPPSRRTLYNICTVVRHDARKIRHDAPLYNICSMVRHGGAFL